jgi:hypothetical protein
LRESKAYTYGAYSSLSPDRLKGTFNACAEVRNAVTDSAMDAFIFELKKMRNEPAPESEVEQIKSYLTGNFAIGLESPQTIARYAINTARFNLPKDYYQNYLKNLAAITPEDVQAAAMKYITPTRANIIVVGSKDEVADKLKRFASNDKVNFMDVYANEIEASSIPIPAGVTATTVLKKYFAAIGGEEKMKKVQDMELVYGANMQGAALDIVIKKKAPNKFKQTVTFNSNMVVSKQVFDGTKGKASNMQGSEDITGKELDDVKLSSAMFPEMEYEKIGSKVSLKAIEIRNGKQAYKLIIEFPWGNKQTEYYDVESGLKVAKIKTQDGPQGSSTQTTEFSDYKEVSGIKIPYAISQNFGPQIVTVKCASAEINRKMKDSEFVIE